MLQNELERLDTGDFHGAVQELTDRAYEFQSPKQEYAALTLTDEKLFGEIFSLLSSSVNPLANQYSDDGSYAASISRLPIGLRAMAATHHLDISLTLDDLGWHFLNFGEPFRKIVAKCDMREVLCLNEQMQPG